MMGCPPEGSSQHITLTEADPRSTQAQAQPLTTPASGLTPESGHLYSLHRQHSPLASPSLSRFSVPTEGLSSHPYSLQSVETHFSSAGRASEQQQQHFSAAHHQVQQQHQHLSHQSQHRHQQMVQGQPADKYHQPMVKESVASHSQVQYQHFGPEKPLQPHHYPRSPGTAALPTQQQQYHLPHSQTLQVGPSHVQTFLSSSPQGVLLQAPAVSHAPATQVFTAAGPTQSPGYPTVQTEIPSICEGNLECQEGGSELKSQESAESIARHQYRIPPPEHSPSDMLDKKPTLQVMTAEHSPSSPGSTTSSPRFIFPDMQRSSSSGHLASDSGSSPFMSPVKREVKWEVGTPPQSSELDLPMAYPGQPVYRERARILSGDTELSETLVDSETGSSILEDSSSSREQSPFSAMAESLSLRSPSEHSPSPLARRVFQRQAVALASEDEDQQGDELEMGGGVGPGVTGEGDTTPPPKLFKKRLHERYVLSLKDCPQPKDRLKEEYGERYITGPGESGEGEVMFFDPRRPLTKTERPDSPQNSESSLPKSPRRSSSDTDNIRSEVQEIGASSADEGDVFMEPKRVRTKTRPPSLHHQREPLDLSRGTFYSGGFRSSPPVDAVHLSPAAAAAATSKHFSPPSVFRSPIHHRLPPHHQYSPHQGLLSPQQQQSQSPLCSVPEGGRIFNFNVPSPLEGAHSDSDLISPSPMSPRIFTFPPQGMMNPMTEVNRLAVSPRAPYTPPPSYLHKGLGSPGGSGMDIKFGEEHGFYGKRSLSESDMTYLCPVCGQVFPTNDNLAKHMAKHLPTETIRSADNNKVHYCKVCNRSFSRSDMLTRHMRLHTGLKPYECGDCGQVFSRSDHLNTHRRTHTGEKPYRCPQCPYAACRRDMITRHMRTHVKRTSRRGRYLSVPDEGDGQKSGSISSTETTDSVGHTCSVSSVDSVECESPLPSSSSTRHSYIGASVDSLLSPEPEEMMSPPPSHHQHHHHHHHRQTISSGHKPDSNLEEEEGREKLEGSTRYERFMHYRKARNWSTTSLESVDSEEASLIREVFMDDPFQETELTGGADRLQREGGSSEGRGMQAVIKVDPASKDVVSIETQSLQKCFISRDSTGSSGGSS